MVKQIKRIGMVCLIAALLGTQTGAVSVYAAGEEKQEPFIRQETGGETAEQRGEVSEDTEGSKENTEGPKEDSEGLKENTEGPKENTEGPKENTEGSKEDTEISQGNVGDLKEDTLPGGLQDPEEETLAQDWNAAPEAAAFSLEAGHVTATVEETKESLTYGDTGTAKVTLKNLGETDLTVKAILVTYHTVSWDGDVKVEYDSDVREVEAENIQNKDVKVKPGESDAVSFSWQTPSAGSCTMDVRVSCAWENAPGSGEGSCQMKVEIAKKEVILGVEGNNTTPVSAFQGSRTKEYDGTCAVTGGGTYKYLLTNIETADQGKNKDGLDKIYIEHSDPLYESAEVGGDKKIMGHLELKGDPLVCSNYQFSNKKSSMDVVLVTDGEITKAKRRDSFTIPDVKIGETPKPVWEKFEQDITPVYFYKTMDAPNDKYGIEVPVISGTYNVKAEFEETDYFEAGTSYAEMTILPIVSPGRFRLTTGTLYQLDEGQWQVAGDATVYEGGSGFYATVEREYVITKK